MRLDVVFDSLVVGSLWGVPMGGPQVCTMHPRVLPHTVNEATGIPVVGIAVGVTAFVNVNVVPMDTERVLANQTVLIEGDRITALGPASQVPVPAGARRIDGLGKYLIPGLADMHVHSHPRDISGGTDEQVATNLVPYIADGVTTIRYFYIADDALAQRFKKAEALGGPRIYTPGFVVDRRIQGVRRRDSMAADIAEAKVAGRRFVYMGSKTVNSPQAKTNPAVDSFLATARRLNVAVAAHDHGSSFGKTLALGAVGGSIEHLAWFRDTLIGFAWQHFGPIGQRESEEAVTKIPPLAAAAARAGLWVTPTLHCIVNSYNPHPLQTMLVRRIVKGLQDAGVGLLLAGDDGYSVHDELAELVRAGLTPYQALLAGTRNVAKYMDLLDSSGTVAVGKRADLVLLSGNPLVDIRYTREPAGVMFHGGWLDRAELDRRLLAYKKDGDALGAMVGDTTLRGLSSWFRLGMLDGSIVPGKPHPPTDTSIVALMTWGKTRTQQYWTLKANMARFERLSDSLAATTLLGSAGASAAHRLRQQLAHELGAMRALLPPEKYVAFDPVARLWLREQARQGFSTTIAGVAPTP